MTPTEQLRANREAILARYKTGESTCSIGRDFGCSNALVWKFLRKEGVALRQIKVVTPNKEAILELHHQGLSAYAISKQLGISDNSVSRALHAAGIDISSKRRQRKDPLVNHREEITRRYLAGEGTHVLGKAFGCQDCSILRSLQRWGVVTRSVRDNAYAVDEGFFDVIDTEVKAYVLGFFMADGCNVQHVPAVSMYLTDEDILRTIAKSMGWTGPVNRVAPRGKGKQDQYGFSIGSRWMSDALARVGCVSNKTYHATFPTDDQVPLHLHQNLIRGWLDGDGTIVRKADGRNWYARVVGTEAVCRGISACVHRHLGFTGSVCPVHDSGEHITWAFTICAREQLHTFLDWLYRDATIFLARKRALADKFRCISP